MQDALVPVVPDSWFDLQRFADDPPKADAKPDATEGDADPKKDGAAAAVEPPLEDEPLDIEDEADGDDGEELDDDERAELEKLRGEVLTPEERYKREAEREKKRRERLEARLKKVEAENLRQKVARAFNVPTDVVAGATKAEMLRSAKTWQGTITKIQSDTEARVRAEFEGRLGKVITPEIPKEPAGASDDLDKQIKEATAKGDVATVTRLVTQKLMKTAGQARN